MNWEAIGAISESLGAIAVIVSLFYVAIQIRQNTRVMKAAAKQSLTEASQALIYKLVDQSELWVKLRSGVEAADSEEDARMSLMMRAMFRGFEAQCYQYDSGLLDEDEWQALRSAIQNICGLPGVRKYWIELKPYMSSRLQGVVGG